eukprot:GABW01000709.1.p2 GENE.GABW01000709.1~~GABW01000709.1.p2  ORF type:complete len:66 (-),score=19.18 GABW01000709.1:3-200(-)
MLCIIWKYLSYNIFIVTPDNLSFFVPDFYSENRVIEMEEFKCFFINTETAFIIQKQVGKDFTHST